MTKSAAVQMRWIAMKSMKSIHAEKILAGMTLAAFVGVLLFSMTMNAHGEMKGMGPCPLTVNRTAVCPMSIVEHFSAMQKLLTAPLTRVWLFGALLLFAVAVALPTPDHLTSPPLTRFIRWKNTLHRLFAYLHAALSQGILQPLVYEPSL